MTETPGQKYSKIFIVGPTESLLTQRGNRHPALAQFLVGQGYNLEYVTSNFYHAEKRFFSKKEVAYAEKHAPYKLKVVKCLGYKSNISLRRVISNILLSLNIFFYLLLRLNKKSLLVLPSRPVEMIFAVALLRLLKRNSVLLDIQDVWPDMLPPTSFAKKLAFYSYCNALLYPSLRFIDKFMHTAPSFVKWLRRYAPAKKSIFIPLGYDNKRWGSYSSIRAPKPSEHIKMVCVAKLQHQIDCLPIVEAIKETANFSFEIIGEDGSGDRFAEITNFIEKYNLGNVTITGKVTPEEVPKLLYDKQIGVVPMISPSIPNKIFDYLASGLPILVLGENDSARFVVENGIGWSCSYNCEGVRCILDHLIVEDIKEKSQNVMNLKEQYSREVLFQKISTLILQ